MTDKRNTFFFIKISEVLGKEESRKKPAKH
jgi:hypothetical protein